MVRWMTMIVWIGCSSRGLRIEALADATVDPAFVEGETLARGLVKADPVPPPPEPGYGDATPAQWDEARILIDDAVEESAMACLRDPNTILAQFAHGEAETIYTVSLRHPPTMTASAEGFVDEASTVRIETKQGQASYAAKFGKDRDDFRAKRVRIEAPAALRPCR
ncbi:MAG: hypothetical protein AAF211_09455 [Myxococcota bacterium]